MIYEYDAWSVICIKVKKFFIQLKIDRYERNAEVERHKALQAMAEAKYFTMLSKHAASTAAQVREKQANENAAWYENRAMIMRADMRFIT